MVEELRAPREDCNFLVEEFNARRSSFALAKLQEGKRYRRRCRNGQGSDMFGSCMGGMWALGVPSGGERRRTIVVSFGCRSEEPNLHDQHVCGTARRDGRGFHEHHRHLPPTTFFLGGL